MYHPWQWDWAELQGSSWGTPDCPSRGRAHVQHPAQVTWGQAHGSRDTQEVTAKDTWGGNGCWIQEELQQQQGTQQLWSHMFTRPAQLAGPAAAPGFDISVSMQAGTATSTEQALKGSQSPSPKLEMCLMHSPEQRFNSSVTIQPKFYLIKKQRSQKELAKVPHTLHYKLLQWTAVWYWVWYSIISWHILYLFTNSAGNKD